MLKSMTGFGRYETVTEDYKVTVEIKSVNHRYCDVNVKLPRKLIAFESDIRTVVKEFARRGKIDVFVGFEDITDRGTKVVYHPQIASGYVEAARQAVSELEIDGELSVGRLLSYPNVVTIEADEDAAQDFCPILKETVRLAGRHFSDARKQEGINLESDLTEKLKNILSLVEAIELRSPDVVSDYRVKITEKVQEMIGDRQIDEGVLAAELALFADKVCVDEETVRLRSHVKNMQETMQDSDAVGRKLDFIAQEMNREANTILSKANDRSLSRYAIDLKTEVEKLREQIQNIE